MLKVVSAKSGKATDVRTLLGISPEEVQDEDLREKLKMIDAGEVGNDE